MDFHSRNDFFHLKGFRDIIHAAQRKPLDFIIHFIQRTRDIFNGRGQGDFQRTMEIFFHEPAQALARNIVVIALGFVPMFFATLVPYVTVGAFFFAIMLLSGGSTLLTFPALLSNMNPKFLAGRSEPETPLGVNPATAGS